MDFITTADVEAALGRELAEDEEERALFYIKMVSTYISKYTGVSFEQQEVTVSLKSDFYGVVELPGGPVTEVSSVEYYDGFNPLDWQWDGTDQIYNLSPKVGVRVTYTRGYATVPEDIEVIVQNAVVKLIESPTGQETGPLFQYEVGDVKETYKPPFSVGMLNGLFTDIDKLILDEYRITATSWRIGFTQADPTVLKSTESFLFE